jgi:hypothetical protein
MDGITVHSSDDCRILRNSIRNCWRLFAHPSAMQTYRGVRRMRMEGNLLYNSSQGYGISSENVDCVFVNNMIVGSRQKAVGLKVGASPRSAGCEFDGNTMCFGGGTIEHNTTISVAGDGHGLRNNIIGRYSPHTWRRGGAADTYEDYNVFCTTAGAGDSPEGLGEHSKIMADPGFRNAPRGGVFALTEYYNKSHPSKSTTRKLCLLKFRGFAVGDHVEINFDGKKHVVTEVGDDYIVIDPPVAALSPQRWDHVANWKDNDNFAWDLRLRDDSPAKAMGDQGQAVGSAVDIQAYLRGDFDGDGTRDLPAPLPDSMLASVAWPGL